MKNRSKYRKEMENQPAKLRNFVALVPTGDALDSHYFASTYTMKPQIR